MRTMGWVTLALVASAPGCDGGSGDTDAGLDPGSDAGSGNAVEVAFVYRDAIDGAALEGVTVAVDAPDGTREEHTTDASGRVTVAFDWDAGAWSVTHYQPGYVVGSGVGLDADDLDAFERDGDAYVLEMQRNEPITDRVTLSGAFTGADDPAHAFTVQPIARGAGIYQGTNTSEYTVEVPRGVPFRMLVMETTFMRSGPTELTQVFYALRHIEVPALDDDTVMEIDLSSPDPLTTVDGSVASVAAGDLLADAQLYGFAYDGEVGGFYGAPSVITPGASGGADYTFTYSERADVADPLTQFQLTSGPNRSQVTLDGWPTAGAQAVEFMPAPDIRTPAFGTPHPLHDPIRIANLLPAVRTQLVVYDAEQEDRVLWSVIAPNGEDLITIPELPSTASVDDVFPASGDFYIRPVTCDRHPTRTDICARLAVGRQQFDLVIPR